jgi:hypothetical protein
LVQDTHKEVILMLLQTAVEALHVLDSLQPLVAVVALVVALVVLVVLVVAVEAVVAVALQADKETMVEVLATRMLVVAVAVKALAVEPHLEFNQLMLAQAVTA